jgi:hypothetical protein
VDDISVQLLTKRKKLLGLRDLGMHQCGCKKRPIDRFCFSHALHT